MLIYAILSEILHLTTLLERRERGDLVEKFKNFMANLFLASQLVSDNILVKPYSNSHDQLQFFSNRVVKYYNKLPGCIKIITKLGGCGGLADITKSIKEGKICH